MSLACYRHFSTIARLLKQQQAVAHPKVPRIKRAIRKVNERFRYGMSEKANELNYDALKLLYDDKAVHHNPKYDLSDLELDKVKDLKEKEPFCLHTIQYKGKHKVDIFGTRTIFLHGLFGSTQNYRNVARMLSKDTKNPVYAMDLRNHGCSPHRKPYDYMTMAKDVIFTMDFGDFKNTILVGHSMGAKVAMIVALLRPDLVQKLVIIDNSPVKEPLDSSYYTQLVGLGFVERMPIPENMSLKQLYQQADQVLKKFVPSSLFRLFLLNNLRLEQRKTKIRPPVLNFLKDNVLEQISDWPAEQLQGKVFTKPVKVMKALRSNFITRKLVNEEFSKYFTQIDYEEFDTSHWLVFDDPHGFVESLEEFSASPPAVAKDTPTKEPPAKETPIAETAAEDE